VNKRPHPDKSVGGIGSAVRRHKATDRV
jgi:hypothetical protein